MSPEERQMLADLFERIRANASASRDPQAEAFINDAVRAQPYAPYVLAQTVLVQQQALRAARTLPTFCLAFPIRAASLTATPINICARRSMRCISTMTGARCKIYLLVSVCVGSTARLSPSYLAAS